MQTDFVEREDSLFGQQLTEHGNGLDTHGATVGFTPTEIGNAKDDAKLFNYLLNRQSSAQTFGQEMTDYKKLARHGNGNMVLPASIPQMAANPIPLPTVTAANIEFRFRQRAARAKAHPNYTTGIGEALKIVKPASDFNPNNGTPIFKVEMNFAGHPHLKFKKGGWQGVEIWKIVAPNNPNPAPDDPGFKKLERVFGHDYVDPSELPSPGSEVWAYKMIYIYNNQQVGNWSSVTIVTVGGL
jgi:hypothetical protein